MLVSRIWMFFADTLKANSTWRNRTRTYSQFSWRHRRSFIGTAGEWKQQQKRKLRYYIWIKPFTTSSFGKLWLAHFIHATLSINCGNIQFVYLRFKVESGLVIKQMTFINRIMSKLLLKYKAYGFISGLLIMQKQRNCVNMLLQHLVWIRIRV